MRHREIVIQCLAYAHTGIERVISLLDKDYNEFFCF